MPGVVTPLAPAVLAPERARTPDWILRTVVATAVATTAIVVVGPERSARAACDDGSTTTIVSDQASSTTASLPATTSSSGVTATTTQEQAEESLRLQIAADYVTNVEEADAVVANPCLDRLDQRLSEFLEPGSVAFAEQRAFVEELVTVGQAVRHGDPDLLAITIESVELVDDRLYTEAMVTVCEVDNRKRVTTAE